MTTRRVYYIPLALLLAAAATLRPAPAGAQVQLTLTPYMVKGAARAPVTIVEFADYQ